MQRGPGLLNWKQPDERHADRLRAHSAGFGAAPLAVRTLMQTVCHPPQKVEFEHSAASAELVENTTEPEMLSNSVPAKTNSRYAIVALPNMPEETS